MNFWLFSSKSLDNIEVARDRLLWGFWDRDAGEKFRRNWRDFIKLYNRIKPFYIAIFQIAQTGTIHAIGIVKETYYDDQTPIWPDELKQNQVLFPWKVSFSSILFSKDSFTTHYIQIQKYVDGYGIGELPEHEYRKILEEIHNKINVNFNLG